MALVVVVAVPPLVTPRHLPVPGWPWGKRRMETSQPPPGGINKPGGTIARGHEPTLSFAPAAGRWSLDALDESLPVDKVDVLPIRQYTKEHVPVQHCIVDLA